MELVLYFGSLVSAQVPALGADSFDRREATERRLDNFAAALFLPASDPDPEIDARLKRLRARNLRWLNPEYVERVVYGADFGLWVRHYLVSAKTRIHPADIFSDLHQDWQKGEAVFEALDPANQDRGFVRGNVCPGEYEKWLDFLDYHWHRAPMPRSVEK